MKKLKVVQIGTKHDHARPTFQTLRDLSEEYEVLGWYEPDEAFRETAESWEQFVGAHEFLTLDEVWQIDDLDAVIVETEESLLTEYSLLAAEHGLHVHMDKPGSPEIRDFTKLLNVCREKKLAFQIGYMYRYNPAVKRALELLREGKLGEITSVEANMGCLHNKEKREWLGQYKGGMLYFLGCHLVDLVYLFQGQPEKVLPLSKPTGLDGVEAEDYGAAAFAYPNGVSFVRTSAAEVNGFNRRQLVIVGSKATLEIYPLERHAGEADILDCTMKESYVEDACQTGWRECGKTTKYPPFHRYKDMMIDYAAMVRGEKENPFTLDYELAVQKLVLDACGVEY